MISRQSKHDSGSNPDGGIGEIMKYKKKPVVIEAKQLKSDNAYEIILWAHENLPAGANSIITTAERGCLKVRTLEGPLFASVGDYVIKGINGEFYPCKPDIFDKTYEPVTGD